MTGLFLWFGSMGSIAFDSVWRNKEFATFEFVCYETVT